MDIKKFAPYIGVIALFTLICAVYFAPQFEDKVIPTNDVIQYEGMSKDIKDLRASEGVDAGWTGGMFCGMPAYLITVKYPAMIIRNAVNNLQNAIGQPFGFIFFAFTSFWIMLLLCGVNPWVGLISALAYGFSTYFFLIIGAGHVTKMWALAYAPLLIGGVFYTYRRNIWLGGALTALFAAIEIGAGHPQITYYFGLIIAAYAINEFILAIINKTLKHFAKATAVLLVAAALSVGANYSSLHYTMSHSSETIRGGSELAQESKKKENGLDLKYATQWSYGKSETLNTFIPGLYAGGESFSNNGLVAEELHKIGYPKSEARKVATQLPTYYGDQPFTAGPTYIGAVIIFFAVLGMFLLEGRKKWWVFGVSLLAILLAWGSNLMWFTEFAFKYLPGYNKFRTVSMTLAIAEFTIPLLAAFVLAELWKGKFDTRKALRSIAFATAITGGIALIVALFGGSIFTFSNPAESDYYPKGLIDAMIQERQGILAADAWRTLILVLASAGVTLMLCLGKLKRALFVTLCAALVIIDMWSVNKRFLNDDNFKEKKSTTVVASPASNAILQDKEPGYRVLNLDVSPFNDATTSYFHRSVGGYHGAKLSRYQDLIENHLEDPNSKVYSMLNTKYIIMEGEPYLNPDNLGAAWFVDKLSFVDNAQQEINSLGTINLANEAVVDKRFADVCNKWIPNGIDSTATIELVDYRPNRLRYESHSSADKIAVFSEIYYPDGWSVTIDGKPAEYFRANYVLRAMIIPAGEHSIEWTFEIPNFQKVEGITLASSIAIILAVVIAVIGTIITNRKKRETDDEAGR